MTALYDCERILTLAKETRHMPAITLPWSTVDFQIDGVKVGTLSIDANLDMTFTDLNGNQQGPYATDLNTTSGSLGNTSTCDASGCLTINGVTYDKMTGNIAANGTGNGNLHVKNGQITAQDNPWSAAETTDSAAKYQTSRS